MLSDDDFLKLLGFLDRPWAGFRKVRKGLKKRVRRHMTALGCTTVEAYLGIIGQRPEERHRCEQALIVTISRFFRDRQLWQGLRDRILPELIRRFKAPIRIWSAGCANGEEAYSLAMTWQMLDDPPPVRILATDANPTSLERARLGIYNPSSLKEIPDDLLAAFFQPHQRRQMVIHSGRLPPIDWRRHDLFDPPPAGPFHMIMLRNNILTYHQGPGLIAALNRTLSALISNGCLVVGSHEHLPAMTALFSRDASCPWVYSKRGSPQPI